jgi:cytochrome oxidase Cu insertion factor (SCO1/SenC/PrrC family)
VLGPVLYIAELTVLHRLAVPWYAAVLGTVAALLAVAALVRARTVTRGVIALLLILLAGFEWFFLAEMKLPTYDGPVAAGALFPAFASTRADGSPFTDNDLKDGRNTVLVFFRGRW